MKFNYLVEKNRMIKSLGNIDGKCSDSRICKTCPLSSSKNDKGITCCDLEVEYPLEATEIVSKWADNNPQKTRKEMLKKAFPNASIDDNCVRKLGLCSKDDCRNIGGDCFKCWNMVIEE